MYERLKRLYESGKITEEGLLNAVAKGWLTQEQYDGLIEKPEQTSGVL